MTKQQQIHKGNHHLNMLTPRVEIFTSPSKRVLTQYYSVLSKKTPVLSKHPNIHRYI